MIRGFRLVGSCRTCASWGAVNQDALCLRCAWAWRRVPSGRDGWSDAPCRRCAWVMPVTRAGVCLPCLLAVRLGEENPWAQSELHGETLPSGRPRQLTLYIGQVALPEARPHHRRGAPQRRPPPADGLFGLSSRSATSYVLSAHPDKGDGPIVP
ncbi:hypothetical protein GCM10010365_73160 [Streptomyces poonensis]|uniref:Uncharacterized protein n=1 Tax=Streptomyces poonensis TaxID=68255 RepID=A0A918UX04_9ACTN|nr:hypothetical protein GCM10010365_73160 [Streptomyces poonensis]